MKSFTRFLVPALAAGMLGLAVYHVVKAAQVLPTPTTPAQPPRTAFGETIGGAGIVEPSTEASTTGTIAVGSQLSGVVTRVAVRIGQEVKAGDLLFELDPRQTEADLKVREAAVPVNEAQIAVAEANLRQATDQHKRAMKLYPQGGIAEQEFVTAEQNYHSARGSLALAKANLQLARAQVDQDRTILALLKVQATVGGTILQINVRPGEYVAISGGQSLIVMGSLRPLHVRVDIDEHDIPRFVKGTPATASPRGHADISYPLYFVRVEPNVIPKKSLTGDNTERVDTRVLQVIYSIVNDGRVYVGQQMDVFIDATADAGNNSSSETANQATITARR
jgi:RND family efflux transporter MFP subunit